LENYRTAPKYKVITMIKNHFIYVDTMSYLI